MKFVHTLAALALAAAAGAQAQTVDISAKLAASGVISPSPSSVSMSVGGGLSAFRTITVSDTGAGFDSSLSVTLARTGGGAGELSITGDTCSGATLAPMGTCTIHLEFDGTCPKADTSTWRITITSTTAATVVIPVTGVSRAGICV
jgi:hypothetical protein